MERAQALQKARESTATRGYQNSRKLRHRIEHLFGETKQSHGLGRARFRGLAKMKEQATLTATVQNLKRLVNFLGNPGHRAPNQATTRPRLPFWCFYLPLLGLSALARVVFDLLRKKLFFPINNMALHNG